jgi:hypothetical protein
MIPTTSKFFRSPLIARVAAFTLCFLMTVGNAAAQMNGAGSESKEDYADGGPSPEWSSTWTGSFTCEAVNNSTSSQLSHITTDNGLKLNYTPPSTSDTVTFTSATGSKPRTLVGIPDTGNTITTDNNSSNTSLSWWSTKAIGAVIVGGNSGNRIYWMPEGSTLGTQFNGSGFQNSNGSTITKVLFCYHEPATVTIIKTVSVLGGSTAITSFPFTSTNLGASSFSLIDNDTVGPDRLVKTNLYKFAKWGMSATVTESLIEDWTLSDLTCTETDTVPDQDQYATTTDFPNRKATIRLEEGESVTCTYTNTQLNPTAAPASIGGRVIFENGVGVRGAMLTLLNVNTGQTRNTVTNSFGYYYFGELPVEDYYVLTVSHRKYGFFNDTRSFTLFEDLVDIDFVQTP